MIVVNGKASPELPELDTEDCLFGIKDGGAIDPFAFGGEAEGPPDRCMLDIAGKAGGLSSSESALSFSLSES